MANGEAPLAQRRLRRPRRAPRGPYRRQAPQPQERGEAAHPRHAGGDDVHARGRGRGGAPSDRGDGDREGSAELRGSGADIAERAGAALPVSFLSPMSVPRLFFEAHISHEHHLHNMLPSGNEQQYSRLHAPHRGGEDARRHDHGGRAQAKRRIERTCGVLSHSCKCASERKKRSKVWFEITTFGSNRLAVPCLPFVLPPPNSSSTSSSARRTNLRFLGVIAVSNARLCVAKYARLTQRNGSDIGVSGGGQDSTRDEHDGRVHLQKGGEAVDSATKIMRRVGSDRRKVQYALLEESTGGEEFALNLVASPTTPQGVQVTFIWVNLVSNFALLHLRHCLRVRDSILTLPDPRICRCTTRSTWTGYKELVVYAEGVCRAVGIKYGVGHCELKAKFDEKRNRWVDPVMIEIASHFAGVRKVIMAEATIAGWHPFDAMVDAYCGFPCRLPPSFSPRHPHQKAVHVYK
ncbi:hypothetical protein ACHAWF_002667 [Thalassiosira exigua]